MALSYFSGLTSAFRSSPFQGKKKRSNFEKLKSAIEDLDKEFGRVNTNGPHEQSGRRISKALLQIQRTLTEDDRKYREKSSRSASLLIPWRGVEKGTSTCLEYALRNKLFHKLVRYGLPDRPQGMRAKITLILESILSNLHHSVLGVTAVHSAVRKHVHMCISLGDLEDERRKGPCLKFLKTLCKRLRDPTLALVFFQLQKREHLGIWERIHMQEEHRRKRRISSGGGELKVVTTPEKDSKVMAPKSPQAPNTAPPLPPKPRRGSLETPADSTNSPSDTKRSLLPVSPPKSARKSDSKKDQGPLLIFSALLPMINDDDRYAQDALSALLSLAQLPSEENAKLIVRNTGYCLHVVRGLDYHYKTMKLPPKGAGPEGNKPVRIALNHFFKRISYIDILARSTYPTLANQLCENFLEGFLRSNVLPDLVSNVEREVVWVTKFLVTLISRFTHPGPILDTLMEFIVGSHTIIESKSRELEGKKKNLRDVLLDRFESKNDLLAEGTLLLFESIVKSRNQRAMQCLLLDYVKDFQFADLKSRGKMNSMIEEDGFLNFETHHELLTKSTQRLTKAMPQPYFVDAEVSVLKWVEACNSWTPPVKLVTTFEIASKYRDYVNALDDEETDIKKETVKESPFLRAISKLITKMRDLPHKRNLLLTSILSTIASCPEQHVHAFFLCRWMTHEDVNLSPTHALDTIMQRVCTEAGQSSSYIREFQLARRRLDISAPGKMKLRELYARRGSVTTDRERIIKERRMGAVVVLEEFMNELQAISKVKVEMQKVDLITTSAEVGAAASV